MPIVSTPPLDFKALAICGGRRIFFQDSLLNVDFNVTQAQGKGTVSGQVLSRGHYWLPSVLVHLISDNETNQSTWSNYIGEFAFKNIPEGKLVLEFDIPWTCLLGFPYGSLKAATDTASKPAA